MQKPGKQSDGNSDPRSAAPVALVPVGGSSKFDLPEGIRYELNNECTP